MPSCRAPSITLLLLGLAACGARSPLGANVQDAQDGAAGMSTPDAAVATSPADASLVPSADGAPAFGSAQGVLLRMDGVGPVAWVGASPASTPCELTMGLTYAALVPTCVPSVAALGTLVAGRTSGDETWATAAFGLGLTFAATLAPDAVLLDGSLPDPNDSLGGLAIDPSLQGSLLNDYADPAGTQLDLHGAGAVYKEYARLVMRDLHTLAGIAAGPPEACLLGTTASAASYPTAAQWVASLPAYCTGFEGIVTAAPPGSGDVADLGLLAAQLDPGLRNGLKPGALRVDFCADANGDLAGIGTSGGSGYHLCGGGQDPGFGVAGPLLQTSLARAAAVFGRGASTSLPPGAADLDFYFREYVVALLEYLTVGAANPVPDLSTVTLDYNDLAFVRPPRDLGVDAGEPDAGAGTLTLATYTDRRFVQPSRPPLLVRVSADLTTSTVERYELARYLSRGESAVAVAVNDAVPMAPASDDTGLLTNVFGSPLLAGWPGGAVSSAYACATEIPTPSDCPAASVPTDTQGNVLLDDNGKPLFTAYPGAMHGSVTSFTLGQATVGTVDTGCAPSTTCNSHIFATVPVHLHPYDPSSPSLTAVTELLPWRSQEAGAGFSVLINGEVNQFVPASALTMSGVLSQLTAYYDACAQGPAGTGIECTWRAARSAGFLGRVFVCASGADVLSAGTSTTVGSMLEWLTVHPEAYDACGLIIRYSPYDNYATTIQSGANGVSLGIDSSERISDAMLFTAN